MAMTETTDQARRYDCVIMGAGLAGVCLARHLRLNAPELSVVLIDPRGAERDDRDLKVGESTVEIAALHLGKELGLINYMIENHAPKTSLNFHWPKQLDRTETLADYYCLWANRPGAVPSYNLNRAKFEQDVLALNVEAGAEFIAGHVVDFELRSGGQPHRVRVRGEAGEFELEAANLVDASGFRQLIGHRLDNIVRDPAEFGLANASAWVRVRGVDRTLFEADWHPERGTISSYYATNHLFGHGHWVWLIPSALEDDELSVGVVFHKDKIPLERLAKQDQFLSFLEHNHTIAHRLIASGEIVDFKTRKQIAFASKRMISPDGWYVLGDAAFSVDAFYSTGSTTIAIAVETISDVIRARAAGRPDAGELAETFDAFNLAFARQIFTLLGSHSDHLGNPSLMSWRIYFELTWWFGFMLPMYVGKYHRDPRFARVFADNAHKSLLPEMLRSLDEVFGGGANLGLLDVGRADSLGVGVQPLDLTNEYFRDTQFDPKTLNLARSMRRATALSLVWYARLYWNAKGLRGVLGGHQRRTMTSMVVQMAGLGLLDRVHSLWSRGAKPNPAITRRTEEFAEHRQYRHLRPWKS